MPVAKLSLILHFNTQNSLTTAYTLALHLSIAVSIICIFFRKLSSLVYVFLSSPGFVFKLPGFWFV